MEAMTASMAMDTTAWSGKIPAAAPQRRKPTPTLSATLMSAKLGKRTRRLVQAVSM